MHYSPRQPWTYEAKAKLRLLIAEGKSFSEAGYALGYTRNAVAGQCKRMGIKTRQSSKSNDKPSPKPRKNMENTVKAVTPPLRFRTSKRSLGVSMMQITDGCRWPVTTKPFLYCGQPTEGRIYCQLHHGVCNQVGR